MLLTAISPPSSCFLYKRTFCLKTSTPCLFANPFNTFLPSSSQTSRCHMQVPYVDVYVIVMCQHLHPAKEADNRNAGCGLVRDVSTLYSYIGDRLEGTQHTQ